MIQSDNKNKEREYKTPVLFEYGDIASITQNTAGEGDDGMGNLSGPPQSGG